MTTRLYNVAVVGATGNVGRTSLDILSERRFPVNNITALSSARAAGEEITFDDDNRVIVRDLESENFKDIDIAFFCTSSEVSAKSAARAAAAGTVVIDKSSYFRMQKDIPLIVPEVNANKISGLKSGIVANPNCCAIPIAVVLKPLDNLVKIKRVVITTYQSVSGAGRAAMDELYNQTKDKYVFKESEPVHLPRPINFNIIPQIGELDDAGNSDEEVKICEELGKILGQHIKFSASCARVPVFIGHSMFINIEFTGSVTAAEVREVLAESSGVTVDDKNSYSCPADVAGSDDVFVSRIRQDSSAPGGINIWVSSDNLRKGAALNAVQIAEEIITKR